MKEYPAIPGSRGQVFQEFTAYVFSKLDGSNIRVEYNRKAGWYKFGTRTRLLDATDPIFGGVPQLFQETCADALTKVCRDNRLERVVAFFEFLGEHSFAGQHIPEDPKMLFLIDLAVHKQGILGPQEYLQLVKNVYISTPTYLGIHHWTRELVEAVWQGEFLGTSQEGVVGKAGAGHKLIMAKAKTKDWVAQVKGRYDEKTAANLIHS